MVVNYVQQQGSDYIGKLVLKGLKEGSPVHAGLHAILGCAGAAASNQSCSAGALGGAAASVLTALFADPDPNETAADRETKRNLITSLVTAIAAASDPSGAATANNAAIANVDNNWLATQQEVQARKEIDAEPNLLKKMMISMKWDLVSLRQDGLTGVGIVDGFKDGMAEAGLGSLDGAAQFMRHPKEGIDAMIDFASSTEGIAILGEELSASFKVQLEQMNEALEVGGDVNAVNLGRQMGQAVALVIGAIAGGGSSAARSAALLSRMGIDIASKTVKQLSSSFNLDVIKKKFAKLQDLGRIGYKPFIITPDTLDPATVERVLAVKKGVRPLPETYLSLEYQEAHAKLFSDGIARFQSVAPEGVIGRTETWVLPKSVAQDAISRANGDISKLEQYLGLDKGTLGQNPVLISINKTDGFRIPSGNEYGANGFWRPGGFTSPGGLPEAVMNPVQPGDYTVTKIF